MTISEVHEKYDDEHLNMLYATYMLDGRHEWYRLVARVVTKIHNTIMNALRICGKTVDDKLYKFEDDALPVFMKDKKKRHKLKARSWKSMRGGMGFK